jgi:hypothetical protein
VLPFIWLSWSVFAGTTRGVFQDDIKYYSTSPNMSRSDKCEKLRDMYFRTNKLKIDLFPYKIDHKNRWAALKTLLPHICLFFTGLVSDYPTPHATFAGYYVALEGLVTLKVLTGEVYPDKRIRKFRFFNFLKWSCILSRKRISLDVVLLHLDVYHF